MLYHDYISYLLKQPFNKFDKVCVIVYTPRKSLFIDHIGTTSIHRVKNDEFIDVMFFYKQLQENVEKKANEKTDTIRASSNRSLQLLMNASGVCINSSSFVDVVQGKKIALSSVSKKIAPYQ